MTNFEALFQNAASQSVGVRAMASAESKYCQSTVSLVGLSDDD